MDDARVGAIQCGVQMNLERCTSAGGAGATIITMGMVVTAPQVASKEEVVHQRRGLPRRRGAVEMEKQHFQKGKHRRKM